jgi:AraC family transcriptional regulator, transcriptional activator of pobA
MTAQTEYTLIDPQTKGVAFSLQFFEDGQEFLRSNSYNHYCMLLISEGEGRFKADVSDYSFANDSLLCFSIYQPFQVHPKQSFKGVWIKFHPDFFCIHKHQEEVACNGILFNNAYNSPMVMLHPSEVAGFQSIIDSLKKEMQDPALAQYELLISYLKIFLITATRIKLKQMEAPDPGLGKQPFILKTLKDSIEGHFKTKHSPSAYAEMLHISAKALNRLSKIHFYKTLTELIADRIVIEAKRELYLTNKPIKAIAYDLGFDDEYYFSRFFKNNADVSPQTYRQTVGSGRGSAA